jgi:hypothetical protein
MQEAGTKVSPTGNNAGGRAGQSQATPEMGVKQMPNAEAPPSNMTPRGTEAPNQPLKASPFNVSSKGVVNPNRPPSPLSPRGVGYPDSKWNPAPSKMTPLGLGYPAPIKPQTAQNNQGQNIGNVQVKSPRTSPGG